MSLLLAAMLQAVSASPAEPGILLTELTNANHWELVSTKADGPLPSYGTGGIDALIFTADGSMCAISSKPVPPAANGGANAYCGEFVVNEAERYVVFDVQTDALPNDLAGGIRRYASVEGDTLTLRAVRASSDVEAYTLTFKRSPKPD